MKNLRLPIVLLLYFFCNNPILTAQELAYPILFVHGWAGHDRTWWDFANFLEEKQELRYGGNLDYCLNPDGDTTYAENYIYDFYSNSNIVNADYYTINFDISRYGVQYVGNDCIENNDDFSNQSAVYKQGSALYFAIKTILQKTGKDKVVLCGFSMGGLAIREYLQNPKNWQSDGKHHVAKLITIDSPNGGSNLIVNFIKDLIGTIYGLDKYSEAVRDLHYPDNFSNINQGIYLFGGNELNLFSYYNNRDVNCNGIIGDNIIGLNQRVAPSDVNYATVTGRLSSLNNSDGIVEEDRQDLNNFLIPQIPLKNIIADKFSIIGDNVSGWKLVSNGIGCFDLLYNNNGDHSRIAHDIRNYPILMNALDESKYYSTAYNIKYGVNYKGMITPQAENDPNPYPDNIIDYDDYRFVVPTKGRVTMSVNNPAWSDFYFTVVDANYNVVQSFKAFSANVNAYIDLNPGTYFFEISATPTANSYLYHYQFQLDFKAASGVAPAAAFAGVPVGGCESQSITFTDQSIGNPTSWSWTFPGGTPSSSTAKNPTVTYKTKGNYDVTLKVTNAYGTNTFTSPSYIIITGKSTAEFTYVLGGSGKVSFTNTTKDVLLSTKYEWDFGDGTKSYEKSPTHTYNKGTYTAKLTVDNGCGVTSYSKTFTLLTSAVEDIQTDITYFPNPTDGRLQLNGDLSAIESIQITDILGNKQDLQIGQFIDLFSFQPGSYIITTTLKNGKSMNQKIIKI